MEFNNLDKSNIKMLLEQGKLLDDQCKFSESIVKYEMALIIDQNSLMANLKYGLCLQELEK